MKPDKEFNMEYEKPTLISLSMRTAVGICFANGSAEDGTCFNMGNTASSDCASNGNSALGLCDTNGTGFA